MWRTLATTSTAPSPGSMLPLLLSLGTTIQWVGQAFQPASHRTSCFSAHISRSKLSRLTEDVSCMNFWAPNASQTLWRSLHCCRSGILRSYRPCGMVPWMEAESIGFVDTSTTIILYCWFIIFIRNLWLWRQTQCILPGGCCCSSMPEAGKRRRTEQLVKCYLRSQRIFAAWEVTSENLFHEETSSCMVCVLPKWCLAILRQYISGVEQASVFKNAAYDHMYRPGLKSRRVQQEGFDRGAFKAYMVDWPEGGDTWGEDWDLPAAYLPVPWRKSQQLPHLCFWCHGGLVTAAPCLILGLRQTSKAVWDSKWDKACAGLSVMQSHRYLLPSCSATLPCSKDDAKAKTSAGSLQCFSWERQAENGFETSARWHTAPQQCDNAAPAVLIPSESFPVLQQIPLYGGWAFCHKNLLLTRGACVTFPFVRFIVGLGEKTPASLATCSTHSQKSCFYSDNESALPVGPSSLAFIPHPILPNRHSVQNY